LLDAAVKVPHARDALVSKRRHVTEGMDERTLADINEAIANLTKSRARLIADVDKIRVEP
jgi:hypothetical protein